jgi:crotonobetainyl-CoA:carnitine CoA-transferase CaiB-like acyl-CoA transferase
VGGSLTTGASDSGGAFEPRPLDGVRVLDLTQVIAGPYCTLMLADMGADVVKLERLGHGDDLRTVGRYRGRDEHEDYFHAVNRSKRSIALDLKRPEDRACAQALATKANVLVENFAPGTAKRLGLGWQTVHGLNPQLVYCSISGFGQTGPYRDRLALDPIIQAVSGIMSVTGEPGGSPMQIGAPLADVMAGMQAAFAIVAVLRATERDGRGRHIDISMQDVMLAALGPRMGEVLQAGLQPERFGNQNPMRVPADTYATADGRYITVICQNQRHWAPLCRALEKENWLADERFATPDVRVLNREILNQAVQRVILAHPAAYWARQFEAHRVSFALVNTYLEAVADPQIAHRGTIRNIQHPLSGPIRVVGPPWIINDTSFSAFPPPLLGQHTDEVIAEWLGSDETDMVSTAVPGGFDGE